MTPTVRRVGLLGAGTALLGVLLSMLPRVLELEEVVGLGGLFRLRGPLSEPAEVLVVGLSADSAEAYGLSTEVDEWPRTLHAELIDKLTAAGAAVIAFDIIFESPREPADHDRRLAEAIERAGNVVLLEKVSGYEIAIPGSSGRAAVVEERIQPIEPLRRGALATAPFTLPTVPIRVGQFWTFGRAADDTAGLPTVALHAYALAVHRRLVGMLAAARPGLEDLSALLDPVSEAEGGLGEAVRRLRTIFRTDPTLASELCLALEGLEVGEHDRRLLGALIRLYAGPGSRYLNYYGPARTIRTLPLHSVLALPEDDLRRVVEGRAVFVGASEPRQPEQQDTFFSVFSERSGQNLSGVEIGATAFANLLHGDPVEPLALPVHWAVVAAWGFGIAALALLLRSFAAVAAGVGAAAAYAAAAYYLFASDEVWAPLVVPLGVQLPTALLAGLAWSYGLLREQRERIRGALGYYVPVGVVDRLAQESAGPKANRELVFGTCLVTDAEQYTTLSEALHPAELGELMDAYYDVLVGAVHRHGGVVSDIGGDSMVAVWPAVQATGTARVAACEGALEVQRAVEEFNRLRVRRELPTRIGLDSGQLLLGNVGARVRGEYRAVGDIVNTAARLQGLNRLLGTRVLLSAAAADGADGLVVRALGEFLLVGKRAAVSVLELQDVARTPSPSRLNDAFAAALERFRLGDWGEAARRFRRVAEQFPDDGPTLFFLEQCRALGEKHPSGDWDGVVIVPVK